MSKSETAADTEVCLFESKTVQETDMTRKIVRVVVVVSNLAS